MTRTQVLQEIRRMRFEEAYGGWQSRRLTQEEAARLLGGCERTFRRCVDRYEDEGHDGLVDKRLGEVSARRAPVDEVLRMHEVQPMEAVKALTWFQADDARNVDPAIREYLRRAAAEWNCAVSTIAKTESRHLGLWSCLDLPGGRALSHRAGKPRVPGCPESPRDNQTPASPCSDR